jgi:hypothetical protein
MLNDPCGTCKRKGDLRSLSPYAILILLFQCEANVENGTVDAQSLAAQNLRRRQMDHRLTRPSSAPGPTTPVAELTNLRANVGKVSSFTVFIEIRRSTAAAAVDKILGKTCVPYPEATTFQGES